MTIKTWNRCGKCNAGYAYEYENCPHCNEPQWACTTFKASVRDYGYDIETYPNIFTFSAKHIVSGRRFYFEISERVNQSLELYQLLLSLSKTNARMVGFNNIGFDYPVVHHFMLTHQYATVGTIYNKAMSIINSDDRFGHIIWPSDRIIEQLDLYKIHHFDNAARSTSLKTLQINMRSESVEDLPYKPGTVLTHDQMDKLKDYNDHDVDETIDFYFHSVEQIEFREELSDKYNRDLINHNDTKIGKDYFVKVLEEIQPGICYGSDRKPRQTIRQTIDLSEVVFPYISFTHPEFNRILNYFKLQKITETKGVFKDLHCTVNDFEYHFGVGGIHGSLNWAEIQSDNNFIIIDVDVKSYYPRLAIANKLYPAHLSSKFCDIYLDVYNQRQQHSKKEYPKINAMLKLALNGVYGDSNNPYSPFYDPQYTMSITINGQLLLCMLAEWLSNVESLKMIQINTDGLTVKIHHDKKPQLDMICQMWEEMTQLELESVEYKSMYIRDVNNYIAEYNDGKLKRKGAYEYELEWHKNHSSLIIQKAVEADLIHNVPVEETIRNCRDPYDFMIKAKVPRSNKLILNHPLLGEVEQQGTSRYYVSNLGGSLIKVAPPVKGAKVGQYKRKNGISDSYYHEILNQVGENWDERIHTKNKSKYTERRNEFEKGYLVSMCNNVKDFDWSNLNYQYYIDQALKLLNFDQCL